MVAISLAVIYQISDGSGGWYIGGAFTRIGGSVRRRLAHVLSDGTVDPVWFPNVDSDDVASEVYALALSQGVLYVGGSFLNIDDQRRYSIAAISASTGSVTSWAPSAIPDEVRSLAVDGGVVYAGGGFTTLEASPGIILLLSMLPRA